jgi:enoyl-CoA hydratase/carnithine racemase
LTNVTEAGVMTITLNRVDKKNSITAAMYAAMADALVRRRPTRPSAWWCSRAMRPIFSAGNDIGDFLNKPPPARTRRCSASCTASPLSPSR